MATISVYQPNFASASQSIRISIDGVPIGAIGPGETVVGQTIAVAGCPWKVVATCGLYRAEAFGLHDAELQIQWIAHPPTMELKIR